LGCYDSEKIAFIPYSEIQDIFYQNDFNWKVTPSNTETKEFKQVYAQIKKIVENSVPWETYLFYFEKDEKELRKFIKDNFIVGKTETTKIRIDKNNFITIYTKWFETVKPTITVNWDIAKKNNIIDGDFYLADLLSETQNDGYFTLKDNLSVLLKSNFYETKGRINEMGMFDIARADFSDNQKAHNLFWAKYERPPLEEYWDYIVSRRDLIVPQDVRERKGSFFTPPQWVELSQRYLADVFGKDWQDEYYIWDCCSGTGNLLAGLTNKYNIWASTLDQQDVDVMHDRINNGANLLHDHVFRFDFLNDSFDKLPEGLQKIINNQKLRKRLIIYINPPYAEAMNKKDSKNAKTNVNRSSIEKKYLDFIGKSVREIYVQFMTRIYREIPDAKLAQFSKLKFASSPNFATFRKIFNAKFKKGFVIRANTFDNVSGNFPISFTVWDLENKTTFKSIECDVIDNDSSLVGKKTFFAYNSEIKYINDWLKQFVNKDIDNEIATMCCIGNDFQHNIYININHRNQLKGVGNAKGIAKFGIAVDNLIESSIYFAVRKVISADWLNDRDQFLFPNKNWEKDIEFHND